MNISFFICTFAIQKKHYFMGRHINPKLIDKEIRQEMVGKKKSSEDFFGDNLVIIIGKETMREYMLQNIGKAFLSQEVRVMLVKKGFSVELANLKQFRAAEDMLMITPSNCVLTPVELSDDFEPKIIAFGFGVQSILNRIVQNPVCFKLSKDEVSILDLYFNLIAECLHHNMKEYSVLEPIVLSFTNMIGTIMERHSVRADESEGASLMQSFANLLSTHGDRRRDKKYFCKMLDVSSVRLCSAVKRQTGLSVQQWLNDRVIQEAKSKLKNTETPVAHIGKALGFKNASQFGTFFKKHTGQTPAEYRKSVNN